jgi:hypothetical protein
MALERVADLEDLFGAEIRATDRFRYFDARYDGSGTASQSSLEWDWIVHTNSQPGRLDSQKRKGFIHGPKNQIILF